MLAALRFFILVAVLAVAAVWLADNPGHVRLDWQGYRLETSVGILLATIAAVAIAAAVAYRIWIMVREAPGRLRRARDDGRRRKGYLSLTRGMVAVAAGDSDEARRHVARAETLLGDPPLTMLLSAQAAQLAGDDRAAAKFFTDMLEQPETEFLGIRGLLSQALKTDDWERALELAGRGYRLRPGSEWVATQLFQLQVRGRRWAEAGRTLDQMISNKMATNADARRRRAVLEYQVSLASSEKGQVSDALKQARRAHELVSEFVPATVRYAKLLATDGKQRKAVGVLENAWRSYPHPALVEAFWEARQATDAVQRVQATERLVKSNPDHLESRIAMAGAALEARLWGEARKHLELVAEEDLTVRACRLWAQLEESGHGDMTRAHAWLVRGSHADPDRAWVCTQCGHTVASWEAVCAGCGGFDTLDWRSPPHVPTLVPPPPPPRSALPAEVEEPEQEIVVENGQ